jgi:hypothetical protein
MTIPRWRLALTAGALVVLGAVGGGLVQAAATPASSTGTADADAAAASAANTAILLDALALMSDPTADGAAVPAQLLALRDRIQERITNIRGRLVHGSLTVLGRDGKLVTYQFDHGTVSSIGRDSVTIAESGGSSVTVSTSSATRVRQATKPSTLADLKVGDEVLVRSTVAGGSAAANVVIILPAVTTTTPPSRGNG